jgi:histidinol-phosphate aminotransferase
MSRFFSRRHAGLTAYVPGEQPKDQKLIKLNTNEAPFSPSQSVLDALSGDAVSKLNLYPDPTGIRLREALAGYHGVSPENITLGNGSDESLAFTFLAFFDGERTVRFPDITYGLYPVLAGLFGISYETLPLGDALEVRVSDYIGSDGHVVLANPNAPTGIALSVSDIARIAESSPDRLVVVDEAYADFARESAVKLTQRYDNLIVVRTFSKSWFFAGGRIGYAVGNSELIRDIETIRNSFNPYNINSLTLLAGEAAIRDCGYYADNWKKINNTRADTARRLRTLDFTVTPSQSNFLFAHHDKTRGAELFARLRERGILVRRWDLPRIAEYLRITVGTDAQMDALIGALTDILQEEST